MRIRLFVPVQTYTQIAREFWMIPQTEKQKKRMREKEDINRKITAKIYRI